MKDRLRVYAYSGCGTCRRALKFLSAHAVPHEVVPIRERPPASAELQRCLAANGGEIRRLFNTSGQDYRRLGLSGQLSSMPVEEAFVLLAGNGNLVKRPFVVRGHEAWCGFDEADWRRRLELPPA